MGRPQRTRRGVLATGATALAAGLAGCQGRLSGDGGNDAIAESEPLVTHQRFGRGGTAISYQTSAFYSPIEAESSQSAAASAPEGMRANGRASRRRRNRRGDRTAHRP